MKPQICLLTVLVLYTSVALSQVCPTATFNTQYNQTTNLGGVLGENPMTNPFTYTYTAGAGTRRLMLLAISYETEDNNGPNNFAAVTYGGVALTNALNRTVAAAGTQNDRLAIYYLREAGIAARVGNTVNISFTNPGGTSPNGSIMGVAVSTVLLENVDQVTPLLNIQSNTNTNIMTILVPAPFTATAGNYIIAAVNMAISTATVGPADPSYNVYVSQQVAGSHTHSASYKQINTTGSEQPGFTANISTRQIVGSVEVKAFSVGGSCSAGLLPVKITSFSGNRENNAVKLNWKTETESHIASYNIQRSGTQGADFTTIGNTVARNSSLPSVYIYNDVQPLLSTSFYRLQILGMDGTVSYSNIIKVNDHYQDNDLTVVSPFNTSLDIFAASSIKQVAVIGLYDNTGRNIFKRTVLLEKGMNSLALPVDANVAKGLYFINIQTDNKRKIFKIVKE